MLKEVLSVVSPPNPAHRIAVVGSYAIPLGNSVDLLEVDVRARCACACVVRRPVLCFDRRAGASRQCLKGRRLYAMFDRGWSNELTQ